VGCKIFIPCQIGKRKLELVVRTAYMISEPFTVKMPLFRQEDPAIPISPISA
jgi:hypothetical protein